jgi:hypothetical protein
MMRCLLITWILYFSACLLNAMGTQLTTHGGAIEYAHPGTLHSDISHDLRNMNMFVSDSVAVDTISMSDSVAAPSFFEAAQDSLIQLAKGIIQPPDDEVRDINGLAFQAYFHEVLEHPGSMSFSFDSLKTVSIISAPDSSFRMITWYVPYTDHRFRYFGFFQTTDGFLPLTDSTEAIANERQAILTAENWFGAYYYEIIHNRYKDRDLYTLLGWKGDNPDSRKRVIEPLMVLDGAPVFGAPVFMPGTLDSPSRIVFEYSAMVSMSLVYESPFTGQGQPLMPMIIFDRLAPIDERFWGQYQYYAPEGNIFDALEFRNDGWYLIEDVDARKPPDLHITD